MASDTLGRLSKLPKQPRRSSLSHRPPTDGIRKSQISYIGLRLVTVSLIITVIVYGFYLFHQNESFLQHHSTQYARTSTKRLQQLVMSYVPYTFVLSVTLLVSTVMSVVHCTLYGIQLLFLTILVLRLGIRPFVRITLLILVYVLLVYVHVRWVAPLASNRPTRSDPYVKTSIPPVTPVTATTTTPIQSTTTSDHLNASTTASPIETSDTTTPDIPSTQSAPSPSNTDTANEVSDDDDAESSPTMFRSWLTYLLSGLKQIVYSPMYIIDWIQTWRHNRQNKADSTGNLNDKEPASIQTPKPEEIVLDSIDSMETKKNQTIVRWGIMSVSWWLHVVVLSSPFRTIIHFITCWILFNEFQRYTQSSTVNIVWNITAVSLCLLVLSRLLQMVSLDDDHVQLESITLLPVQTLLSATAILSLYMCYIDSHSVDWIQKTCEPL